MRPCPYKTGWFNVYPGGRGNPNLAGTDAGRRALFLMARAGVPAAIAPNHGPSVPFRIGFK